MGSDKAFQGLPEAYQVIFENTGTAMLVIADDMRILLANSELEKIIGYSRYELEEKRLWSDFVCSEDVACMQDYHRRRRSGDTDVPSRYSFRMLDRQNRLKDVSVSVTMLPGTSRSIASVIDVSDLKRVERELRVSEKRYRTLVEDMPGLICRFRSDGTLTFVNQACCRYFDRSAEELLGHDFFHFIPEEERETVRAHFLSLNLQQPLVTHEHKIMTGRGETRWQQWTDWAIFSEEGELVEFQSLVQDITERKRAEEKNARMQARLQQAQRMEAVGRLTAGFAHDCNNILTVIIGFSDIIRSRITPGDELSAAMESILDAARRGAALTRKLLAFSRNQVLQPELLDINGLISAGGEMLRRLLGENIELRIVPGGGIPLVNVDPVQMEQVIMNLAINARDAMPEGGKLVIETEKVRGEDLEPEHYAEAATGTYVSVTVSDTGTGMAEEILPHIFEPFYSTKEVGKGTGLGLSTGYGVVKQSGGFIRVDSRPGEGSSFRVFLPAGRKTEVQEERRPSEDVQPSGRKTVLVVEDDDNVMALLDSLLRNNSFAVLSARQGSEALCCLKSYRGRIDLLVTDLSLPGINGLELAELAEQARSAQPDLKVLYISGYPPDSDLIRKVQQRKKSYLAKPFDAVTFLNRVREML